MNNTARWIKEWGTSIVIALLITLTVNTYVAQAVKVVSGSMKPTIQIEDRLLVEKIPYLTHYHYGDVVVFHPPVIGKTHERFVKRLIGLPGDTIEVKDGALFRNGEKVEEPYISDPMNYEFGPVTVPEGKFLMLGDNRNNSFDSHLWDTPFVDKDEVIGKALFRFYPFDHIESM